MTIVTWLVLYVLAGGLTARITFVRFIDKYGRNSVQHTTEYGRALGKPHDPFAKPFWSGVCWPFVLVAATAVWLWRHLITRPTSAERRERKKQDLQRTAAEIRQMAERYGLPVEGYLSDGLTTINIDDVRAIDLELPASLRRVPPPVSKDAKCRGSKKRKRS